VVKPRSLGVFVKSTAAQIDVAVSQGYKLLILVPGSIGERMAKHLLGTPTDAIIQTGDFFGYMIKKAIDKGVKHIVILGHPGKLVKLAAGIFNTNHNVADARREVVAAYAALAGASRSTVETIFQATTTEEMAKILKQHKLSEVTFSLVADAVRDRVFERISGKAEVNVVIVSLHGEVLGFDSNIRDVEIWRKKFSWSALDPDPKNM
jgi:cobalt-precorrin-5B (C1)-methyltransferase